VAKSLELLSFGIIILLAALSLALSAAGQIGFAEVPSLVIALFGIWIMASAGIRPNKSDKQRRSAFSVFSWGVLISALGTVWFLSGRQVLVGYLPSVFLAIIGILVVVAALRYWRK